MNDGICVFKCNNEKSILQASKLIWDEGQMPSRIVLCRKEAPSLGSGQYEFMTYRENLILCGDTWEHREFYWGSYHGSNHKKAQEDFLVRSKLL